MGLWTNYALVALTFSALTFASISCFSPFWYTEDPEGLIGLFAKCKADSFYRWKVKSCVWSHENLLQWTKIQPTWWHVCQTLMVLSVVTMFMSFIISVHMLRQGDRYIVQYDRGVTCLQFVNGFFILCAFIEVLATVSHFGKWANAEREVQVNKHTPRSFGWAYLLACLACLIQFVVLIIYALHIRLEKKTRKQDQEYRASLAAQYGHSQYGQPSYPAHFKHPY